MALGWSKNCDKLAGAGPALQLGIGTRRVALALLQQGVAVQGISASQALVARPRAKPRKGDIEVHMGWFQHLALKQQFQVLYVVLKPFCNLPGQDEQVRCLQSVTGHLSAKGHFGLEALQGDVRRHPCRATAGRSRPGRGRRAGYSPRGVSRGAGRRPSGDCSS